MKTIGMLLWAFLTAVILGAALHASGQIHRARLAEERWREAHELAANDRDRLILQVEDLERQLGGALVQAVEAEEHTAQCLTERAKLARALRAAQANECRPLPRFEDGLRVH